MLISLKNGSKFSMKKLNFTNLKGKINGLIGMRNMHKDFKCMQIEWKGGRNTF